jgi:hypothetical protein
VSGSATQQIVNRAWSFAHMLRDDGLSYMGYTEQPFPPQAREPALDTATSSSDSSVRFAVRMGFAKERERLAKSMVNHR